MIEYIDGAFGLHTADTSYVSAILPTGQLEHLYYGKRIRLNKSAVAALKEKHSLMVSMNLTRFRARTAMKIRQMRR